MGLVNTINRPGGNVTGVNLVNSELGSKRLDFLAELIPSAKTIAFLENPKNPDSTIETGDALAAARSRDRQGFIANASTDEEIEAAFATIAKRRAGAVFVGVDPFFNARRAKVVSLAAQYKIPAIYQFREFVDAGGLISYGASLADAYEHAADYVTRILGGSRPTDLPVSQSVKFELVLNLKTAKALGLTIPPSLIARADEVIE
jgi:putative ABC transport system substrate-binding protein